MQELAGMKVYSLKDVCKLLKIGPKKGLELFNNNEFPAQRVGRSWWIEADAFKRM
ncbi:MAG: helix-turn-helix domain-containing protein [Clostridia bacterium]|nr:helix-turn-helix domain-containing protein [Clostridia bacterium]